MNSSSKVRPGLAFRIAWRERVAESPDQVFLRQDGQSVTYGEIHRHAASLASGLRDLGIKPGDPVLLGMGNHPGFLIAHMAIQWIGAVTVPLVANASFNDIAFPANHSEGRVLIADRQVWATLRGRMTELPSVQNTILWEDDAGEAGTIGIAALRHLPAASFVDVAGDDLAPYAITYTSGSSGRPKGVVLPSGAPLSVGLGLVNRLGLSAADTVIVPTPMAHSVGFVTVLGGALLTTAPIALAASFGPTRFWQDVKVNAATLCCLFPAHLSLLMETQATAPATGETGLRAIFTHAVNEPFVRRFGVALHMCWGMTETGALMAMSGPMTKENIKGYVGEPMPNTRIAAFGDEGRELPAGTPGELSLTHRHVMLRYHRDADATAQTLVDGWIRSGDLGWIEQGGGVHYAGRIKNMIKRSGENVSPEEVEATFLDLAGVSECLVFGTPDPVRTEEVVACLVMTAGARFDPAALNAAAATVLSRWKLPRYMVQWEGALPRLANGKIDRRTIIAACDLNASWDARAQRASAPMTQGNDQ